MIVQSICVNVSVKVCLEECIDQKVDHFGERKIDHPWLKNNPCE